MAPSSLSKYQQKRDFSKTSEPAGTVLGGDGGRFVIHKHSATADHYDLRLEIDGVLVSWAVPKGPSLDPAEQRLAVRTDDHELEHADFEGRYGDGPGLRGTVQVWDRGTYRNASHDDRGAPLDAAAGLENGHLSFQLDGTKLRGAFSLIRTRQSDRSWLLIKKLDDAAEPGGVPVTERDESALTGRTLEQIARDA